MNRLVKVSVLLGSITAVAFSNAAAAAISATKTTFWNGTTWTYTFNITVAPGKGLGSFNSYRIGFASLPQSTGGGITAPGAPQNPIPSPAGNGQTLFRSVSAVPQNPGTITAVFTSVNRPAVIEGNKQYIDVGTFTPGVGGAPGTFVALNNALLAGLLPRLDPNSTTLAGSQLVMLDAGSVAPNAQIDLFQNVLSAAAGDAEAFLGTAMSDSFGAVVVSLNRPLASLDLAALYVAENGQLAHAIPTPGATALGVIGLLAFAERRRR